MIHSFNTKKTRQRETRKIFTLAAVTLILAVVIMLNIPDVCTGEYCG